MSAARGGAGAIWPVGGLYYGWVMLLTLSFTELTSWGILYYSFSVFVTPMQRELGWSRAALTGAFSLALLCSGVAALGVGRWLDRHGSRLMMTAGFCLTFFVNVAVTIHLIPSLTDHGFTPGFAATAAGLIGALALPGRLVFTPLGGWIPRRYVTAAIFGVQALALVVLVTAWSTAAVLAFVALFGMGFGAITPARAALVAELYGSRHYGSISGVLTLFVTVARALAPVSAGLLYTAFGRYEPVFWLLVVLAALAAAAVLLVDQDQRPVVAPEGSATG